MSLPAKATADHVADLVSKAGLELDDAHIQEYSTLLGQFDDIVAQLGDDKALFPRPDLTKYPRTDVYIPKDNNKGGWATMATVKATSPKSDLLKGKTIAIKDNVAVAGVRCTNGTTMVDWTPDYDATLVTRILDAGGLVVGKAACENCCLEGISTTSCTGAVHNQYADNYSCGGSSSGSGRLVGVGAVDMAIGGDQGGSIRIPATCCGVVGHKPTWGLVPYTGVLSLDASIDHAGPMAQNVPDCAHLLEAIAGADGWDDRQPAFGLEAGVSPKTLFVEAVEAARARPSGEALAGLTVGVLKEGFEVPHGDAGVYESVRAAAAKFGALGARVVPVSVPAHATAALVWTAALPIAGGRQALFGDLDGRKQLALTDRGALLSGQRNKRLSAAEFEALGPGAKLLYIKWLYCEDKYGPALSGKVTNLIKGITDAYDQAFGEVDVLVMPTVARPPPSFGDVQATGSPVGDNDYLASVVHNTAPFDSTGHPALSLPCGFVHAVDNAAVKLPTGIMLVGRRYDDVTVLKAAAVWEKAFDWKTM